jgi:uncharacterized protein YciI
MNNLEMLLLFGFTFLLFAGNSAFSQGESDSLKNNEPVWEMKTYYFVFLNAAPDRPKIDSVKSAEIQAGHMANIETMFKAGKCRLAGPFLDNGEMRGIFILDVASEDEAKELLSKDPAIINGRLVAVIKPWYGPAGLIVEPKGKKIII